ncbi:class I SAM-dependent methyltransferase [Luteococcus peritonei]|uniref:Class I SAM-dependent methyltransferase n=1 Tax=Luteococcus peritonei TaxID=88874 RepID=A0ABW4RWS5_9ACTN
MSDETPLWNINIHYDRLLADLAAPGDLVLHVGCGDGFLAARLADKGCRVVALDADKGVLGRARERWADRPIDWVHADLLTHGLEPGTPRRAAAQPRLRAKARKSPDRPPG